MFDAFRPGLRDLGYVEGKNIVIERRYAEGRLDRMPTVRATSLFNRKSMSSWRLTTS